MEHAPSPAPDLDVQLRHATDRRQAGDDLDGGVVLPEPRLPAGYWRHYGMAAPATNLVGSGVQRRMLAAGYLAHYDLQLRASEAPAGEPDVRAAASQGLAGSRGALPHLSAIQRSFGRHDVRGVVAHTGPEATAGAHAMGAAAYATGSHVAFADAAPDLHTAAHEAAHVVQQRAGVQLTGGVGQVGDAYERHADAVADRVVRGESAEELLDSVSARGAGGGAEPAVDGAAVQRSITGETLAAWKRDAAKKTGDAKRKEEFAHITKLIEQRLRNPYASADVLRHAVQQLLRDGHFAKYQGALQRVLDDLHGDMKAGPLTIDGMLTPHLAELIPLGDGDLGIPEVRALRQRILVAYATGFGFSNDDLVDPHFLDRIRQMADRGVSGGQWVGRGLCQEATNVSGGMATEIQPRSRGSTISWNHYLFFNGARFRDPTWKQFFQLTDTAGRHPLFEGTADDFRQLGLPEEDTEQYLTFIGRGRSSEV